MRPGLFVRAMAIATAPRTTNQNTMPAMSRVGLAPGLSRSAYCPYSFS
ncbi:MAG: hypothetical protein WKF31_11285 [Thermoleophilaceae bacterium]